jgi:hypothetical protein
MYKLRMLKTEQKDIFSHVVFGITIPHEIAIFFKNCYFDVEKSGTSIVLTSGANINPAFEELKNYKYEDCIIKEVSHGSHNNP